MAANEEITVTDGASGKVSRALLSAEVLLSSLLDHASGEKVRAKDGVDGAKLASCDTETAASRSLTATNSLVGLGERSLLPSQLSAILSANQPTELVSPRETLQSFGKITILITYHAYMYENRAVYMYAYDHSVRLCTVPHMHAHTTLVEMKSRHLSVLL